MRYCNHCLRITGGNPLFCTFCGRSYDQRLCPQRHPNPRHAEVCSLCGSRQLSTPHPKASLWRRALGFLLWLAPGMLLVAVSALFLTGLVNAVPAGIDPLRAMVAGLGLAASWWAYLELAVRKRNRGGQRRP